MAFRVKQEILYSSGLSQPNQENGSVSRGPFELIELSSSSSSGGCGSSDSDSDSADSNGLDGSSKKRRKLDDLEVVLPVGFLAPLPPPAAAAPVTPLQSTANLSVSSNGQSWRQFWKSGDYEGAPCGDRIESYGGIDHCRVHPKFLHSNATSHKWALGAFAELLDNSLDEVCNGATYANIDMLESRKDGSRMLLIEDNGGGMDPDKMRHCMSLGYSAKSKMANTIGQYGNGFKTSTMRLGADVIVFSRCCGKDGKSPTQSIGLLSYTFLRKTGKEDIIVPMLDYERHGHVCNKIVRSSAEDWDKNVETIVEWSPFSSEADLLRQFNLMSDHGTRIVIYNLWENDQCLLELDFDADGHDIQLRGVNRDERNIQMAKQFPNSRHFLTYRHSLRSYASILYLRLPPGFRIILRGKDVEHHNIVNDMMMSQEITYRPQPGPDGLPVDSHMAAIVTIGFVKDAKHHIDVQGFNVYHKNRLIKPFWRLWNAAGSDGRGVIGVLEANFVEPAHDKQGFERTTVLARLESRLVKMQKTYWSTQCHKIGYAPRRKKFADSTERDSSPDFDNQPSQASRKNTALHSKSSPYSDKFLSYSNGNKSSKKKNKTKVPIGSGKASTSSPHTESLSDDDLCADPVQEPNGITQKTATTTQKTSESNDKYGLRSSRTSSYLYGAGTRQDCVSGRSSARPVGQSQSNSKVADVEQQSHLHIVDQLKEENRLLKERLEKSKGEIQGEAPHGLQCEKCQSLEPQLQEARQKIEELNREQESLIDIFSEERDRRDREEDNLRKKLKDASNTIQELLDKVRLLEKIKSPSHKSGR